MFVNITRTGSNFLLFLPEGPEDVVAVASIESSKSSSCPLLAIELVRLLLLIFII